ncbi:MAG: M20 family peptidase [Acidobacteriota bacterium]|nr:M20 family peptidase [Acidobacteriota bacterium]
MKKIFIYGTGILLLLILILVYRGATFGNKLPVLAPGEAPALRDGEHVARLSKALTYPTITYDEREKIDWTAFDQLHAHLEASFPLTYSSLSLQRVNNHGLLFHWQGSDAQLEPYLLMAHQDVVPVAPGTEDEWEQPPFSGAVDGTYIWGRGAIDDKSSVMAIFEAVETLLLQGFQPKRSLYLAFGQDEEIGGDEGAVAMATVLKEKGIRLAFVLDEGGLIVKDGMLDGVDGQVAMVGIAEKGYVTLELKARGQGGHSSMPPRHTAVGVLSRAITRLEENPFPADTAFMERTFNALGASLPFSQRLIFSNMWLFRPLVVNMVSKSHTTNAMVRTTAAATMFSGSNKENVLPIEATAVVNFRILPGDTAEKVQAYVSEVIDDPRVTIEVRGFASNPSPVSPAGGPAWEALLTSIKQTADREDFQVAPYLVVGATDSRHFTELTDHIYRFLFITNGPDDTARFHGTNERVSIEDYEQSIRFYLRLIRNSDEM